MSVVLAVVLVLLIIRYRKSISKPTDEQELLISMQEQQE